MQPLDVLHEDAFFVAVNKPSGIVVHRGWANDGTPALQRVRDRVGAHVYPVHRLDRGASGVLLFARTSEMAARLHAALATATKHYLALVRGVPPEGGVIDHALARRDGAERVAALTEYRRLCTVEAAARRLALVEAVPRTGRLHQIRRHLKHLGHPIIGDANYGQGALNRALRAEVGLARLALHARTLELVHPETGVRIVLQAPVPEDMAGPLLRLGVPAALL
jgi:tRNA pseudouridine65 synthase